MKTLPDRSMDEIFAEFHAEHGGPDLDTIRNDHIPGNRGSSKQEIAWSIAKASRLMRLDHWTFDAIGRFFNRSAWTIMYHNPEDKKNGKNLAAKS